MPNNSAFATFTSPPEECHKTEAPALKGESPKNVSYKVCNKSNKDRARPTTMSSWSSKTRRMSRLSTPKALVSTTEVKYSKTVVAGMHDPSINPSTQHTFESFSNTWVTDARMPWRMCASYFANTPNSRGNDYTSTQETAHSSSASSVAALPSGAFETVAKVTSAACFAGPAAKPPSGPTAFFNLSMATVSAKAHAK